VPGADDIRIYADMLVDQLEKAAKRVSKKLVLAG
jgi:hypothetical protein